MRVRRGLFRLWIVGSVAWILMVGVLLGNPFAPYIYETAYAFPKGADEPDRFGKFAREYMALSGGVEKGEFVKIELGTTSGAVLFAPSKTNKDELERRVAKARQLAVGHFAEKRMENLGNGVSMAFLPPAIVFLIGGALFWAFSGFSRNK